MRLIMGQGVSAQVRSRVEQASKAIASGQLKVPEIYEGTEFAV